MPIELARARMEAAYEAVMAIEDADLMFAGPERVEYDEARAAYFALLF